VLSQLFLLRALRIGEKKDSRCSLAKGYIHSTKGETMQLQSKGIGDPCVHQRENIFA